jgi:lysophospholipase L1-like esterase
MPVISNSGCPFFVQKVDSPISRIAQLLVILAMAAACSRSGGDTPTGPGGPPAPGSTILYDAVGASDAIGVGSSVVCAPFVDCPNGRGYPQVATRQLTAQGFNASLVSLGVPTAVISPGFQALGQQYGRFIAGNFITQEMPFVRTDATLVTVFAGGNEVNVVTAALGAGAGGSDAGGFIDAQVREFGSDYATLIDGIRARAGSARIVAFNVPNFAGFPYLTRASLAQRQAAQRAAVRMSTTVVNTLVARGVIVIDVLCDARMYAAANFSSDGFHPNDAGYAFLAGEIVRAATSASYPSPLASCGQMTVVPPM